MNTVEFEAVLGVNPGYNHDNDVVDVVDVVALAVAAWDAAAEEELAAGGMYVPAAVTPGKAVYRQAWGCPQGGEVVVVVSGACNARFDDPAAWRDSVVAVARRVKVSLGQSTVRIVFRVVEDEYLE